MLGLVRGVLIKPFVIKPFVGDTGFRRAVHLAARKRPPSQGFTVMQFKVGVERILPVNRRIPNQSKPVSVGVADANCLLGIRLGCEFDGIMIRRSWLPRMVA